MQYTLSLYKTMKKHSFLENLPLNLNNGSYSW